MSVGSGGGAAEKRGIGGLLTVVVLGSVMAVLDVTIVNVALFPLAEAFDARVQDVQWVATGYTLALSAAVPLTSWTMARFGARRVYLTAIVLFAVGSGLAALAPSIPALVALRVVQGLGGGLLMPVGMAMVIGAADRARMGRVMAVLGLPVLLGPASGPVLGGFLIDAASWRWIFLVNLPVGALALVLGLRLLPRDAVRADRPPLDVPGLLTLSPGLALLLFGLAEGGSDGDFVRPLALVPTASGAVLVALFVARALTARYPLVRLGLFRDRAYAAGIATVTLFPCAYFGSMLLAPMYFQGVRGLTATQAGLLGIPLALAVGVSMQVATRLVDRVSPRLLISSGALTAAAGLALFTVQLGPDAPYPGLCAALMVMGTGVGMVLMPANTTATRALPAADVPSGSTTLTILTQVGAASGTALMSVLLASRAAGQPSAAVSSDFRHAYWFAVALLALTVLPALLLPGRRPPLTAARTKAQTPQAETPPAAHPEPAP
ncbi:DHA2 family efflux MFS transporter permease subunit [Actinocorallia sp. A-T 12471]|uniref:DHA2 family efflux MFS transporter permease subunit n=1 Tax=Actinocorallia sp. A-T 12471 TaxID=3089813 RepID=UPI0029CF6EE2|nr:DHA2 family efflux MFS transporter permease subunit [Actinocorallia sp. A-T 12471]MDX6744354.1 DHA2 family efflux MFS transporter permease subunit [Actinocorallia sp. A-T 12471]